MTLGRRRNSSGLGATPHSDSVLTTIVAAFEFGMLRASTGINVL